MTTLVSPITASADAIVVSSPLTAQPYPFGIAIEDERLTVRGGGGTTTLYVNRGQDGTTAAAHAGGVTVTSGWSSGGGSISATDGVTTVNPATSIQFPAGTLSNLGSGVAGVGLLFKMIGPFPIAYNTPGIGTAIAVGPSLPAGTLVLDIFWLVGTEWAYTPEVPPNANAYAGIADYGQAPDGPTSQTTFEWLEGNGIGNGLYHTGHFMSHGSANQSSVVCTAASTLWVAVFAEDLTAGTADIYAIVATPAA